jgi:hypothetical protein
MNGIRTMLSERVESLLPRTAAAACVPYETWSSTKGSCHDGAGDIYYRLCHTSCYGKPVCGPWYLSAFC